MRRSGAARGHLASRCARPADWAHPDDAAGNPPDPVLRFGTIPIAFCRTTYLQRPRQASTRRSAPVHDRHGVSGAHPRAREHGVCVDAAVPASPITPPGPRSGGCRLPALLQTVWRRDRFSRTGLSPPDRRSRSAISSRLRRPCGRVGRMQSRRRQLSTHRRDHQVQPPGRHPDGVLELR